LIAYRPTQRGATARSVRAFAGCLVPGRVATGNQSHPEKTNETKNRWQNRSRFSHCIMRSKFVAWLVPSRRYTAKNSVRSTRSDFGGNCHVRAIISISLATNR
jgi:hypothetical protein